MEIRQIEALISQNGNSLMTEDLPPIEFLMDDFLTVGGVYIFAGASKMGKTWFSLDMSISISQGIEFMGKRTTKCKALYIDRESSKTSLKSRLVAMYGKNVDLSNWDFVHKCECLFDGFQEQLIGLIEKNNYKLIFIDVFAKIRSIPDKGMPEYKHDYKDIGALKDIADKYKVCIVILHHQRKMKDEDDIFNTMSGSTGLMGAPDGAILLARKRGSDDASIHTEGRDIRGGQYSIEWNKKTLRWRYIGLSDEVRLNLERKAFESSPLASVISVMLKNGNIYSSMADLHNQIVFDYPEFTPVPTTPAALGKALKENALSFKKMGIDIEAKRGGKGVMIKITKNEEKENVKELEYEDIESIFN